MMTIAVEVADAAASAVDESVLDDTALRPGAGTFIPNRDDTQIGERRRLRSARLEDRYALLGALAGALAIAALLFGWIAPLSGVIGFIAVAFLAFIALYALLVSTSAGGREVIDRVMTVVLISAGVILIGILSFVVAFTIIRGWPALTNLNFFFQTMQFAGPLDDLDVGGVAHAIVGTLIQIGIALAISIPLGIVSALFLNEVGGRFARFVRTIVDAMTALPSIVAGLFIYSALIIGLGAQKSGFAAALAITVMMLPIMIRASDVVLRLVAGNLREASYALGASNWRTIWHVVLPTARSGLVTAVILATARGIGETSPVLLTSGMTSQMNLDPFHGPMVSLPLQVFDFVKSPEPNIVARGFGTAAVLMLLVLALFAIARVLGGSAPGDLSSRRRRAVLARSQHDLARFEQRSRAHHIETTGYGGFAFERAVTQPDAEQPVATPPAPGHTQEESP